MALGFFRRRQKMVLILMVLLMVTFLIPSLFQGLSGGSRNPAVGQANGKEVTVNMMRASEVDLDILRRSLGAGTGRRTGEGAFMAFMQLNSKNPGLVWTLLLHEARKMKIPVRESEVDSFISESGLVGEAYRRELANLRERGYTEKDMRAAIRNYLAVTKAFESAGVNTTPSLPEFRHVFGELREQIQLAMITVPAENFTTDVPEPTEDAIAGQFNEYKDVFAGDRGDKNIFGFGYRLPDQMEIEWLFIEEEPLAGAIQPADKQLMDYWNEHKNDLRNRIAIPSASHHADKHTGG